MKRTSYLTVPTLALALALGAGAAGCRSGNGTPGPAPANTAPTVNAGADQTVAPGATVTLSGTAADTDGTIVAYLWRQTGGPTVRLNNSGTRNPTFTAPVATTASTLTFTLTVTDNGGASATDTVVVAVGANAAPTANAGPDQTVAPAATVQLAGSGTDTDGSIASYAWAQTAGPAVTLSSASAQNPTFTAPATATSLTFRLTVTDNRGATATDTVVITVAAPANQAPTANAGPDQTVASGAAVQLAGAGTDPDGSIASYAWAQTSGTAVTLSGATTQNPTFTAPTTTTNVALGFRLTVTDNNGATGTDDVVVNVTPATPTNVQISGRITYDRVPFNSAAGTGLNLNNPVESPARGVTVQALNGNTVLTSTQTDASGNYTLTVPLSTAVRIRARAELVKTGTPSWDTRVVDNTNAKALYVLDGAIADSGTAGTQTRNLRATTGWGGTSYTGTRAAAPFAMLDDIYTGQQKVLSANASAAFPALAINWSVNNVPSGNNPTTGQIGTSYYTNRQLFILGAANTDTDEFDNHVILHEWGHYIEDNFSTSDSIGGQHGGGDLLDMRVAFGEGFGNAWSGIISDDPLYRDSYGNRQATDFQINVESNPVAADDSGWYSESSVQSIIYDLYDSAADTNDGVALGFAPIFNVLVGAEKTTPFQTSIFTFITAIKAANAGAASAIDTLVAAQRINSAGINEQGSAETNDAGQGDTVLPVYTAITPNGGAQTVCTNHVFGEYNKLGNTRFLTFTTAATGTIRVTATTTAAGSDPDLALHRRGQDTIYAQASTANSETLNATGQPAGRYVIEANDYLNTDGDNATGGRVCIQVAVTTS